MKQEPIVIRLKIGTIENIIQLHAARSIQGLDPRTRIEALWGASPYVTDRLTSACSVVGRLARPAYPIAERRNFGYVEAATGNNNLKPIRLDGSLRIALFHSPLV